MPLAIFGIDNSGISLVITLAVLCMVALWIALIVFTFTDSRKRISDPFLIGCATAASFFPFIGTIIYTILRPAEFLEDAHEREVEVKASEIRTRHLEENSCNKCGFPTQPEFMRCPSCRTRLKEECPTCSKPVGLDWKLCPYCETALVAPKKRSSRSGSSRSSKSSPSRDSRPKEARGEETPKARGDDTKKGRGDETQRSERRPKRQSSDGVPTDTRSRERAPERNSPDYKPSSSDDPVRRSSRSARRKQIVPDEEDSSRPINSGDSPAPGRTPDSR